MSSDSSGRRSVTSDDEQDAAADRRVEPATTRACEHCPWRESNQGKKPDPHGFYTKKNLLRLWRRIRRGESMTCHPTDSRMKEFEHAPAVRFDATPRECAGALVVAQREMTRLQDCRSYSEYRRLHPKGLLREGAGEIVQRAVLGGVGLHGVPMTRPDLNDLDVQYEPLGRWEKRAGGQDK